MYVLHFVISLIILVEGKEFDNDREKWVDPTDMLNYDSFTKSMRNNKEEPVLQKSTYPEAKMSEGKGDNKLRQGIDDLNHISTKFDEVEFNLIKQQLGDCKKQIEELQFCERKSTVYDLPYMKRFVHQLMRHLNNEHYRYKFTVELSPGDYENLQKFATTAISNNVQDIEDVLSRIFINSVSLNDDETEENIFDALLSSRALQSLISIIAVFLLLWIIVSRIPIFAIVTTFVVFLFSCSVFWHWQHMYKTELANRHAELSKHKDIPKQCKPHEMTWSEGISFWFTTNVLGSEDECIRYHRALLVDPFWDISPAMAFAETLTRFFVQPFEALGTNIGKFYHSLHKNLPFGTSVFVIPFTFIFIMFLFLLCCGYRVRLPFLLSIEPAPQTTSSETSVEQLSEEVKSVRKMMEILTEKPFCPKRIEPKSPIAISDNEAEESIQCSSSKIHCICGSSKQKYIQELYIPEAGEPYSVLNTENVKQKVLEANASDSAEKSSPD